jgi:hypothetical protein
MPNYGGFLSGINIGAGLTIADLSAIAGMGWDIVDVDGEPDEFYFNFGKYSGKFVFDGERVPVTIPYIPGLKIESPFGSSSESWIFTTPEGTKYYFSNTPQYTEKLYSETNATPSYDDWAGPTPNINEGVSGNEYISKWYLSKVEGVNGEIMEYGYEQLPNLVYREKSEIKQFFKPTVGNTSTPPAHFVSSGTAGFYERVLDRTSTITLKAPKRISFIKTSDNDRISFEYNGLVREDIDQSQTPVSNKRKSLSSIKKYDFNNTLVQRLDLSQSYFGGSCTDYDCKRLKLDNIKNIGTNGSVFPAVTGFEYYTDETLPKRNSPQQDYWGYYNNNTTGILTPRVHTIDGSYSYAGGDRTPYEAKTRAGILKKITYPTKGSIQYEYELNNFNPDFQFTYYPITSNKTGGLRIKRITKKENEASTPIVQSFSYKLADGKSSGELPELLETSTATEDNNGAGRMFDRQRILTNEETGKSSVYVMIYSNPRYLFTDDLLRYSRVIVDTEGKGSTEYLLSSFSTNPDDKLIGRKWQGSSSGFILSPTYVSNSIYTYSYYNTSTIHTPDKSYTRGLVLKKIEKDNLGNIIRETINTHKLNPSGYTPKKIYGIGSSSVNSFIAESAKIESLDFKLNFYQNDYVYLENSTVKDYVSNAAIETTESNLFNTRCFLDTKSLLFTGSESNATSYKYAHEKGNQLMISKNMIGIPLETETRKTVNGITKTLSKSENVYPTFVPSISTGNMALPIAIKSYDLQKPGNGMAEITYDLYDDKGNLLQYTTKDGVPVTIIWGYNQTLPIVKIEGVLYSELASKFGFPNTNTGYKNLQIVTNSNADISASFENQTFIPSLEAFRKNTSISAYQVTTYTHDPLIGVTSITPPSGVMEKYIYDSIGKLQKTVDVNGRILKEFKYNYKN